MSIELEYAVKKDIRNNTVVRQADARQRTELRWMLGVGGLVVVMLLFSAWQHVGRLEAAFNVEQRRVELEQARENNRKLRLNLARLRAPEALARRADRVGMRPATLAETVVIERINSPVDVDPDAVVASAR
jgi:hypothetical protein